MEKLTRAQQAQNTKNAIYHAAMKLFDEDEYDKVTISRICKEAGFSVGMFYHYFKSKEEVLMCKYLDFDRELDLIDYSQDVETVIREMIWLQLTPASKVGRNTFKSVMEVHLKTDGKYLSADREFNIRLTEVTRRGIEEGVFDPAFTAEEIAETILRTSRGVLFDWSCRPVDYEFREQAVIDVQNVIRGFSVRK